MMITMMMTTMTMMMTRIRMSMVMVVVVMAMMTMRWLSFKIGSALHLPSCLFWLSGWNVKLRTKWHVKSCSLFVDLLDRSGGAGASAASADG